VNCTKKYIATWQIKLSQQRGIGREWQNGALKKAEEKGDNERLDVLMLRYLAGRGFAEQPLFQIGDKVVARQGGGGHVLLGIKSCGRSSGREKGGKHK